VHVKAALLMVVKSAPGFKIRQFTNKLEQNCIFPILLAVFPLVRKKSKRQISKRRIIRVVCNQFPNIPDSKYRGIIEIDDFYHSVNVIINQWFPD